MGDEEKPVRRVGDYEFLDRIAVGGMGEVWRVRHVTLGAVYVAKVLRQEYREDPQFLKRFLHEARLVANLRHPNIVQVFGYDAEDTLYLMEYVEGIDLDHLLRSKRVLTYEDKRTIIEAVADTIGYAHREVDLIHRDIKPSNVLIAIKSVDDPIRASSIKLTDFGIARLLSASQRVTMSSGMVMGTLHYMAPEQFDGDADKRSDVYSIGILYYQLLTGSVPFDGPTAFVIRDKHVSEVPPPPHEVNPEVPHPDSVIVMRCIEKEPDRRYQDAADLHEALLAARVGTDATIAPQPAVPVDRTQAPGESGPRRTQTEETLLTPGARRRTPSAPAHGPPTAGTAPTAPTEATIPPRPTAATRPAAPGTEPTLYVQPKPRWGRRLVHSLLLLIAVAAVVAVAATQLLKPRYEIDWSTLRSDSLDTPNGIEVSVSPKPALGLWWASVGTIDEQAPAKWANWTTWFSSIDVKLSDGLYREFTITCTREACRPAQPLPVYDFGGAAFEQVAEAHGAKMVEDLAGVGAYVNAVLAPKRLATTRSLPDVRRCLVRVSDLVQRAEGLEFDRSRLDACRVAAGSLAEAAEAVGDGRWQAAEGELEAAEAAIERIDLGGLAALPDDFLFRTTVRGAIAQVKASAGKAERFVDSLEPLTATSRDVRYTLSKSRAVRDAVAQCLFTVPGRAGYKAALGKLAEDGDVANQLEGLGEALPPPLHAVRRYLAKLDALIAHQPAAEQAPAYRIGLLKVLDEAAAAQPSAEPDAWVAKCFQADQLASRERLADFWQRLHRSRFERAADACRQLARRALEAAATQEDPQATDRLLADAEACLDALREAEHASEAEKRAATGMLSACCIRRAMTLVNAGPAAPDREAEHFGRVRGLLDRGLDELGGCPPQVEEQGRQLREMLKLVGAARAALAPCRDENFGDAATYGGRAQTLFGALAAYEELKESLGQFGDHPCAEAAERPFVRLGSKACQGFTLANAAACWLLGRAVAACEQGRYADAAASLNGFRHAPGDGAQPAESPLRRLLAEPLLAQSDALARVAACFDESKLELQGLPEAERWTRLWDARLEAAQHLELDLANPPAPKDEAAQWATAQALMRKLLDHYRARVQAEQELRDLEAQAEKLLVREGATVKANPEVATPEALQRAAVALEALEVSNRHKSEGHPQRLAALRRDLGAIANLQAGSRERIAALLAKPDPQAALTAIAASRAVLGAGPQRDLTGQAVAAWTKIADDQIAAGRYDAAAKTLDAIHSHAQVKRLASSAGVKQALAKLAAAARYCEGQLQLARGAAGLEGALASFREAGAYRDAEQIAGQIGPFIEAAKLRETTPFRAWARLDELGKSQKLHAQVREAAATAARQVGETLVLAAVQCTRAFNQALVDGGWEALLRPGAIAPHELDRIRAFVEQVDRLEVQQTEVLGHARILPDDRQVRITTKRRVAFAYKLPGADVLPVTLEQRIEWTVGNLPPAERNKAAWVIEGWEEAN